YFLDGSGNIRMARPGSPESRASSGRGGSGAPAELGAPAGPSGGDSAVQVPFKIKLTIRSEELYKEMFDQSWRYLAENFYDRKFHEVDWIAVREKYRKLVEHVDQKEDLYSLLYLMMGELNASHLGVTGLMPPADEATADLGLLFDESYRGK